MVDVEKDVAESPISPPSTSAYDDKAMALDNGAAAPKVDYGHHIAVTLIPQPDDDPRDPLVREMQPGTRFNRVAHQSPLLTRHRTGLQQKSTHAPRC